MSVSLNDMPDVVMNKILKKLDFLSVKTLREVNHALRDYIDQNKPDAKFHFLNITLQTDMAELDYFETPIHGRGVPFLLKNHPLPGNLSEKILESFKFTVGFQKSCVEAFGIQGKSMCDGTDYNEFLDGVARILGQITLKVTHFYIQSTNPFPILKTLDPQFLKSIHILDPFGISEETSSIDVSGLVNLEVWKNLEQVRVENCMVENGEIRDFLEFEVVLVMFHTITEFQLKEIMEAFLNPSSFLQEFRLEYLFLVDNVECFGEPFPQEYHEGHRWYFEIPESTEILLVLSSSEAHKYFLFERIGMQSVPLRATIRKY